MEEPERKRPGALVDRVRLDLLNEGLCMQAMDVGQYSSESETLRKIEVFIKDMGLTDMVGSGGKHHEVYLSNPRRARPEKLRTVLRHPVKRGGT
ncbi:MAG: hypothetical protein ACPLPR_05860 [Bacillota bacterium]